MTAWIKFIMTWFVQARCYVDWSLLLCKILASFAMQQPVPAELGRKPPTTGRSICSKMGKEAVFFCTRYLGDVNLPACTASGIKLIKEQRTVSKHGIPGFKTKRKARIKIHHRVYSLFLRKQKFRAKWYKITSLPLQR